MLSKAQEKLITSLQTKKGRESTGQCLVEGRKVIETAGAAVEWTFSREDTLHFDKLVDVQTPQDVAGVARIPQWDDKDINEKDTIVVLDGVQDPGNVGAIMRLALGFNAAVVLVECADIAAPKVIRSSTGALFVVPWVQRSREEASDYLTGFQREIYRLEKTDQKGHIEIPSARVKLSQKAIIIAGSEGRGIQLPIQGTSVSIRHEEALESLNVGHALAIILALRYSSK